MKTRLVQFLFAFVGCMSASPPAEANGYFPQGECGIAVAARQSLAEAREWIAENRWVEAPRVFLSSNGWYAITIGSVGTADAESALRGFKAADAIPQDAYCTSGSAFIKEVSWRDKMTTGEPDGTLWSEFDARLLSNNDKAFLQASLALQGDYHGLLDGAWGRRSQSALERFTRREFAREPLNVDGAYLSMLMFSAIGEEGWRREPLEGLAMSLVLPMDNLLIERTDGRRKDWRHTTKNISILTDDFSGKNMVTLHSNLTEDLKLIGAPYTVRKENRWITSGRNTHTNFYVRSDLILGTWSTVSVISGIEHPGEFALMTGSISLGNESLFLPESRGQLISQTEELKVFLENVDDGGPGAEIANNQTSRSPPVTDSEKTGDSSGTGFFVNDDGVLITNSHVVKDCDEVRVDGKAAKILSVSTTFDLAAVRASSGFRGRPLSFASEEPGLNADITIAGYPLHGLLGGLNVSRGSISSLKGLRGDEINLQISAPVQPGNSGGPMVDQYGNVVGVVVSKLDAVEVANITGDIAQNVNFAIRGPIAMIFLQTNGIAFKSDSNQEPLAPEAIAQELSAATRLIECRVE
ncbi:serine protease [Pseudooceanicola sp.]|uniref:S1 family peptidase n=1 Tax=Pseudooceanicola sp. TaxID=1914328 RepID=UPI003519200F